MTTLANVYAGYNHHNVLHDFSLSLPEHGVIALTGPSGCGKTTLLRLLAGLMHAESGTVYKPPTAQVSFMFQEDRLLPWCTVLENVMIPMRNPDKERAETTLRKLGITELDQYPHMLSGGMLRRISLARAICYDCNILLLDEPFQGLDYPLRDRIVPFLKAAALLIVFSTHDTDDIKRMDAKEVFLPEYQKSEAQL